MRSIVIETTGPAGAHVPIQVIAGLPEPTVRMGLPHPLGAIVHTVEAIRPLGALLQATTEVLATAETISRRQAAITDHLQEPPEVQEVTGVVAVAVQGALEATEVPGAVPQEALAARAGPLDLPVPVAEVEDHKFQNSI